MCREIAQCDSRSVRQAEQINLPIPERGADIIEVSHRLSCSVFGEVGIALQSLATPAYGCRSVQWLVSGFGRGKFLAVKWVRAASAALIHHHHISSGAVGQSE